MTGLDGKRVYLDWNATAPLRPEARDAMIAAMEVAGNPSSVHAEGRAARAIVERARDQVAALVGCEAEEVVFTSGASEANAQALRVVGTVYHSAAEHESVARSAEEGAIIDAPLGLLPDGRVDPTDPGLFRRPGELAELTGIDECSVVLAIGGASSETGIVQDLGALFARVEERGQRAHADVTQLVGRMPFCFAYSMAATASLSGHKLGGPKGTGALLVREGLDIDALVPGGGQERGRRSGTENVIGIAGFGAAAEMAAREIEAGVWERVRGLRDSLEEALFAAAPDLCVVGRDATRLPNTSCLAVPGWRGETQVMALDLAGFAVSAGSACSSGRATRSRVLEAMGFDGPTAESAIRVSLGPTTTEAEVAAFAEAWTTLYRRRRPRAA